MKDLCLGTSTVSAEMLNRIQKEIAEAYAVPIDLMAQLRTVKVNLTFRFDNKHFKTDLLNDRRGAVMATRRKRRNQ